MCCRLILFMQMEHGRRHSTSECDAVFTRTTGLRMYLPNIIVFVSIHFDCLLTSTVTDAPPFFKHCIEFIC